MANKILTGIKSCFTGHGVAHEAPQTPPGASNPTRARTQSGGRLGGLLRHSRKVSPSPEETSSPSSNASAAQAVAKGVQGAAKSLERAVVKPIKHRAADTLVPASKHLAAAITGKNSDVGIKPLEGAQLKFQHQGVYGLKVEGPAINLTHNMLVVANKIGHAVDKKTGRAAKRNAPELQGFAQRPHRQFAFRGPHITVKEGRVKVSATGLGKLNRAQRKQQRARAKIVQNALKTMDGHRCRDVEPHAMSHGALAEYKNGGRRWIGSRGEHIPFAAFDAVKSTAKGELQAPPISLLSGIYELPTPQGQKQGTAWRLEQGKLYVWNKGGEPPSWQHQGEAQALSQHADGNLYAHVGHALMRCHPLELGKAALSPALQNLDRYQSVHVLPSTENTSTAVAVAVDHAGKAFQLTSNGQATFLAEVPGLKNLVPVPGGQLMCGHTTGGEFVALHQAAALDGTQHWQRLTGAEASEHAAFAKLATQIPLDIGHQWHVQTVGYDTPSGAATPLLHAVLASDQGHRISMVYDQQKWVPQYKADATIMQSEQGLQSETIKPETKIQYDQNTYLATNTKGELCIKHQGIGRWEQLRMHDGSPMQNVQKIVTGANELTFGKRVYALLGEGERTSIHEINIGGRMKQLPAHSEVNELGGAAPSAWLSPNRLTAHPGPAIANAHVTHASHAEITEHANDSPIVDLSADKSGAMYQLTQHGSISKTERASNGTEGKRLDLPPAKIGDQSFTPKQITVSGDNGRLFALAQKDGAHTNTPPALLEFVPNPHTDGSASHEFKGTWVNRALEWKDAQGKEIPDESKHSAQLSTSLYGTPVIEVKRAEANGGEAVDRYRILQVPVHTTEANSTQPKSMLRCLPKSVNKFLGHMPGKVRKYAPTTEHRYTLKDVSTSREDPRVGMDRNDAFRPPVLGTQRTALKWTVLGGQYAAINRHLEKGASTAKKLAHYGTLPIRALGRRVYQLGRLTVQEPPMALVRLKQDLWGRKGLAKDYAAIRETMKSLPNIQSPISDNLAKITTPQPDMLTHPVANRVVADTLGSCLEALEQMCITAHVLGPDRTTERSPERMRKVASLAAHSLNKTTLNSRDALPQVKKFWDSIGQDKLHFFSPAEQQSINKIKTCIGLLEKNHIKLWDGRRGALSNFTAYHGSHSIQSAALIASMKHFAEAVQVRTFGTVHATEGGTGTTQISSTAESALKEIETTHKTARANQLAHCGFSGWHAYEAMVEAVTDLRDQINNRGTRLTPGSPLYELVKTDLDLQQAKTMPKEEFVALGANKWAETVNSLNPRTVFGWSIQKNLGAGTYLACGGKHDSILATLSYGGILNLGGNRSSFVGVEAIGSNHNQTEQGPVIVFMTRGMAGTASMGANLGIAPTVQKPTPTSTGRLHNEELNKHFGGYANAMLEGTHTRAKGGAIVLLPEKVHEFGRMLFDDKVAPLELMKMGIDQGGIGLNLRQTEGVIRSGAGIVARQDWFAKDKEFGAHNPASWNPGQDAGKRGKFNGNFGLRAALGLEIYHKVAMELHLRLGFAKGNGFEYQGDSGPRASLGLTAYGFGNAPNIQTGKADAGVASARAASLGLDVSAAELQTSWNSHYKRTADFVKTAPIANSDWKSLLDNARKVPGLKLEIPQGVLPTGIGAENLESLDVTSTEGRHAMRTLLSAWVSKLQDMESAVCHGDNIEQVADPAKKAQMKTLATEAKHVDEHLACKFMLDAESTLLKSHAAELDLPMVQDSARIELNVPKKDPTQHNVSSHLKLGTVMKKAREVEAAIPGIKDVKAAYASLRGYNETRLVFEMDPRKVNLANRLMILGVPRSTLSTEQNARLEAEEGSPSNHQDNIRLSAEQIMNIMESEPMNYHCVVHCAKNNEGNTIGHGLGLGLTLRHEVTATEERFLAETHLKHGWGSRIVRAELLPTAQESLSDVSRGRGAFTRSGVATLRQTQPSFERPVRTMTDVFTPPQGEVPSANEAVVTRLHVPSQPEATHPSRSGSRVSQTSAEEIESYDDEIDPIALLAQVSAQKAARKQPNLASIPEEQPNNEAKTQKSSKHFLGLHFGKLGSKKTKNANPALEPTTSRPSENPPPSSPQAPQAESRHHKGFGEKVKRAIGIKKSSSLQASNGTSAPRPPMQKTFGTPLNSAPPTPAATPNRTNPAHTSDPALGWGEMFKAGAKNSPTMPASNTAPASKTNRSPESTRQNIATPAPNIAPPSPKKTGGFGRSTQGSDTI